MSNNSAEDILNQFKILKQSRLDLDDFYNLYLESCSYLCKSYSSILLIKDNQNIEVNYLYNNPREEFIEKSKELIFKINSLGYTFERCDATYTSFENPHILLFKNFDENSYISLLIDKNNSSSFNEILIRTQLICDTPTIYLKNLTLKEQLKEENEKEEFSDYKLPLELFNILIHKDNFDLALLTLVNELSIRFNCSQVSIGWIETSQVVAKAVSYIESFEKNSDTISLLENLFNETASQEEILVYPNSDNSLAFYETKIYFKHRNISQLVSIPIFFNEKLYGILVCEKIDSELSTKQIDLLNLIVNQISPWIVNLQQKQEPIHKKIARKSIDFLENSLSLKYSGLKLSIATFFIVLILSFFIKIDYKVDGIGSIETDFVTYIPAPYDGIIDSVKIKEGEDVLKDQLLLTFDINELKLKANENNANVLRYTQESEKSRAMNSLADMKIALSKREETQVALDRINYYISQSQIKAPYDGIIVEGNHTKLLGTPVNKGDVILKIAKMGSMFLKIKVNEKEIDNISKNGKFIFLSKPDVAYDIKIDTVIPIAEVDKNEGNVFILKASILGEQQFWWRPGMSGITKLDGGKKTIFWIATHKLIDFFRIYLWW